jgi:hypothetical protein
VTLPRATGFAAWPAATPSSCGPATAAVCVVRKQAAVMQATRRRHGEAWLAVDGGGAVRWLSGPGGVGRSTPHGQGRSGRCLGETVGQRVGFRGWASAWGMAVQQREEPVAAAGRTHGKRHQADIEPSSQCRHDGQQCVGQPTTVLRSCDRGPRTPGPPRPGGLESANPVSGHAISTTAKRSHVQAARPLSPGEKALEPDSGDELEVIAASLERPPIQRTLLVLGLNPQSPPGKLKTRAQGEVARGC